MKSDEGFSDMLDKTILIQYQYENVIRFQPKTKFKRAVFTALFFACFKIINLMNLKKAVILKLFFLKTLNKLVNLKLTHP